MSIFDKIGDGLKSLGNDIKHGGHEIDHLADEVKDQIEGAVSEVVNDAKSEVTHLVDEAKDGATHLFDEAKSEATRLFDEAKAHADEIVSDATKKFEDGIQNARELAADAKQDVTNLSFKAEDIIEDATKGIQTEAVKAKNALEGVGDTIKSDAESAANTAKADIEKAGKEAEDGIAAFGQKIIDEFDSVRDALAKELSQDALAKALHEAHTFVSWIKDKMDALAEDKPALVDKLNAINDTINIGPIALNYANFYTRLDDLAAELDRLTSGEIKLTQEFIIDAVDALAPTTITIDADIEFISRFGDDVKQIPIELITEWLPDILDQLGVPKET